MVPKPAQILRFSYYRASPVTSSLLLSACMVAHLNYNASASERKISSPLAVGYGNHGLVSLNYKSVELLKQSDPQVTSFLSITPEGVSIADPGKCENSFDATAATQTTKYSWGEIACRYKPESDRLGLDVTVRNSSPYAIQHLDMTLLELNLPNAPVAMEDLKSESIDNVPVVIADYGVGTLAYAGETFSEDYLIEMEKTSGDEPNAYSIKLVTDSRRATDREHQDVPFAVGASRHYKLSLRFALPGATMKQMAGDLFAAYAKKYPYSLKWPDRRAIAMIFRSSPAPQHRSATNPRGWLNEPTMNVMSREGRISFRRRMLQSASEDVKSMRAMDAQGMIFWDVEGEEQPHPITYIGDPRMITKLAPEMDAIADEYFKKYTDAGLRTGICIRPSRIELSAGSDGRLKAVHKHMRFDPVDEMCSKIDYARKRWGCTIFYLDTNVTWAYTSTKLKDGGSAIVSWVMRAEMLRRLAAAHPDVLIIPEFQYPGYFSAVSGYRELTGSAAITPERILLTYPSAFMVIKSDDEKRLDQHRAELVSSVRSGDILLYPGWFTGPINQKVRKIYQEARVSK